MPMMRREFLKDIAIVSGTLLAAQGSPAGSVDFKKIVLPPESPLPVRTAAKELSIKTGATIVEGSLPNAIGFREIVLALGEAARNYPASRRLLASRNPGREWEIVQVENDGLVIGGSSPRNVCRAALGWIEDSAIETNRLSVYPLQERFTMWDNTMNQMCRFTVGEDRQEHIREIARMGHTGVEINRYADIGGYWVLHRTRPKDPYVWYMSYGPALDAYVESSLTQGLYPAGELAANLEDLKESARIARSYGLKPGLMCYEPRAVPEAVFDRYPQLRGTRVDHPGRSLTPEYNLDIAHPRVLKHYAELVSRLMESVPDLRYIVFWTSDSGSAIPFASSIYAGPNGSYLAKSKTVEQMAADFAGALLAGGRKTNPEFEVIMELSWEYPLPERLAFTRALPKGASVSHMITRSRSAKDYFAQDRDLGKEPYGVLEVASRWDYEPIFGISAPSRLQQDLRQAELLKITRLFTFGGVLSPSQCPFNVTQDLYAELVRTGEEFKLQDFLMAKATRWCHGRSQVGGLLVQAWQSGESALEKWERMGWYVQGANTTQGRWLTRPLVPDLTLLPAQERATFERALFTPEWDVARLNFAFEGGIRMFSEDRMASAVKNYDEQVLPGLQQTVDLLDKAFALSPQPVIEDQRDRYRGLLLLMRTVRNCFAVQAPINRYLLQGRKPEELRQRWKAGIQAEITNTKDWISLLSTSRTNFFHISGREETPFLYKTPLEDMKFKLEIMPRHIDDEPGPDLEELRWKNGETTLRP
jgi:hypothetical protein